MQRLRVATRQRGAAVEAAELVVGTDHVPDDEAFTGKVALYRTQLAAYGVALETVLDEPVVEARLIFCRPGGATELVVPDWQPALTDLRARLTARR